jgi:hypothetical protein
MKKNFCILLVLANLCCSHSYSAIISLGLFVSTGGGLRSNSGQLLAAGLQGINGDGTVLQIGYYSLADAINPFRGQWVPITGPGTPYQTTIGDGDKTDGFIKLTSDLTDGTFGFVVPAVGTPLALRFYDSTSIASANYFNAVAATDGSFTWVAPSVPESNSSLALPASQIVWQDGTGSAYRTTIAIPEPSAAAVIAFTFGVLSFRRQRRDTFRARDL